MEIVSIDASTFEEMLLRVDILSRKFSVFQNRSMSNSLGKWIDGQEVCMFLRIESRTLQTLRDNGTLAYTQIGKKIFYRPEDVKGIVKLVENNKMRIVLNNYLST